MPATQSPNPNPNLDLTFIGGRGIMMDYLCAKLGDFSFGRFGFIVRTDRQRDRQRRMIATTVGVSKYCLITPRTHSISSAVSGIIICTTMIAVTAATFF